MKKSIIIMSAALALAFTACKDDTSDLGIMQKNEPPTVVESNGVATENLIGENLDLNSYQNINLPIMNVAMSTQFPESAILAGSLQIADNEDFTNAQEVTYTSEAITETTKAEGAIEGATRKYRAVVEGNALENAFVEIFGRSPQKEECYVRYSMFIQDGSQASILEYNGSEWWPTRKVDITPVNLNLDIYASYTIYGPYIGNGTPAEGIVMMRDESKHPWDDPNFTGMMDVTEEAAAAGFSFSICPTEKTSIVYGVAENANASATSGRLVEDGKPLLIEKAGPYKLEVNMETKMYTLTPAFSQLWVPCKGNNNNFTRNCQTLLTNDYINYEGFAYASEYWYLTSQPDRKGTNYVKGDSEGTLSIGGEILDVDNGIAVKKTGLYWITANIYKMTYTSTYISSLGICGTLTNWGNPDKEGVVIPDIKLKALKANPTAYTIWEGDVEIPAGAEWKIRADNGWDINLGGNVNDLTIGGGNIVTEKAGTYHVRLDISKHPWTVTVEEK